jgi:tetratricopeptide (TPR) repeat protein
MTEVVLPLLPERYVCTRLLGEGATGMVYHAEDRLLETEVAVKVIKSNLAMHRRFRARFAREVALSARITHPHVIPVHDTGTLDTGQPYVALGYAAGGSLAELLELRPPLQDVLALIDEVLDALAAIHARQLLHQDLKPQNVLLYPGVDGKPHVWVADLGVADALAELVRDRRNISGTPPYMAPEQLHGRSHDLGPWTDLYAVGLMLYETLMGTRPHAGEGRLELLEARNRPPPAMAGVPAALADVVATLLDPIPRQRFDRAADVRRALNDAMKGQSFRGKTVPWQRGSSGPTTARTGEFPLAAPLREGPVPEGTLRWNRVPPAPMAAHPPLERGWDAPARASLSLFALREVPLVGRDRERKVLWDAAREVVALSEPRVVIVVGESGTGKSRLVESIATELDELGVMEVTRLRYHAPAGVDDGYRGAVRDIVVPWNDTREGMETRLASWLARDRQVLPADVHEEAVLLARWCGYIRPGEPPVSDAIGLAFLYRHLDVRAWRGGSCLILEDVHHAQADGDGLAIAEALLDRTVGERPVLVLCTVSSEAAARDGGIRRTLEGLQERGARRLGLRRLGLTDTRRVVQESLQLTPDLAHEVSVFCEGDPLVAGLLLRDWASRALPKLGPNRQYALPPSLPKSEAFPSSPEVLLRRRVEGALNSSADPVAARDALIAAALAGQQPPVALIRRMNDAGLDALLATGLVAELHGYLAFEHGRIQQLIVEDARGLADVHEFHRRLADAWEELGTSTGLDVDFPLGHHRLRSGAPERALGPLLAAGRKLNAGGRGDAVRAAAMAVEAADAVGQPTARLEARRLHAEALLEAGEPERARPLIEYALREVEGDRLARARLRVQLGRAARKQGDTELAEREFTAAQLTFEALRDRAGMVEVAVQRARLSRMEGRSEDAAKHWTEVLRMNRGDFGLEAEALNGLCEALIRAGRYEHIERQLHRLNSVARASGDIRRIADAQSTWGMLHLERREYEQAAEFLTSAGAIAATIGADRLHLRARSLLADVRRAAGDLDGAEEIIRWAARFARERGQDLLVASARVQLAMLALIRYDPRRVQEEVVGAESALAHSPRHALWLQIGVLRAWLAAEENDERSCRAWFAVARERGLHTSQSPDLHLPIQRLVAACERRGWDDIARRASERVWRVSVGEVEMEEDPDEE